MTGKLAIYAPRIGVPSESFIRRHTEFPPPSTSVVITHKVLPPGKGVWKVDCPVCQVKAESFFPRGKRFIRRKMGSLESNYVDVEQIKRFLTEHRVEVLWGHYVNMSWPFLRVANDLGIRFFVHALGYDLSRVFRNPAWRERYAEYKHASGVIVLNKVMQERLVSVGVPKEKVHIIPCGVDVPETPVKRKTGPAVRCLAVGRMVAKKAPLKLLESFRLAVLENPNLHLDYVGTGPLFKNAQSFIHVNDLQNKVTLHGVQSHQSVIDMMRRANLFVQHSVVDPETGDEEGMPVAILEAMALGLPAVSTNHSGIPEAVSNGLSGYIVEEGDIQGMAQGIMELAGDARKRLKMGEYGWESMRARFSWQQERARLFEVMGVD